jgi:hypothetical protein
MILSERHLLPFQRVISYEIMTSWWNSQGVVLIDPFQFHKYSVISSAVHFMISCFEQRLPFLIVSSYPSRWAEELAAWGIRRTLVIDSSAVSRELSGILRPVPNSTNFDVIITDRKVYCTRTSLPKVMWSSVIFDKFSQPIRIDPPQPTIS